MRGFKKNKYKGLRSWIIIILLGLAGMSLGQYILNYAYLAATSIPAYPGTPYQTPIKLSLDHYKSTFLCRPVTPTWIFKMLPRFPLYNTESSVPIKSAYLVEFGKARGAGRGGVFVEGVDTSINYCLPTSPQAIWSLFNQKQ